MLGPIIGPPVQEKQGNTEVNPTEVHRNDLETGTSVIKREIERPKVVLPLAEKAQGDLTQVSDHFWESTFWVSKLGNTGCTF